MHVSIQIKAPNRQRERENTEPCKEGSVSTMSEMSYTAPSTAHTGLAWRLSSLRSSSLNTAALCSMLPPISPISQANAEVSFRLLDDRSENCVCGAQPLLKAACTNHKLALLQAKSSWVASDTSIPATHGNNNSRRRSGPVPVSYIVCYPTVVADDYCS